MTLVVLLLYAAAAAAYAVHFARRDARTGRAATGVLAAAALAHAFLIGMLRVEAGYMPVTGLPGTVSVFVWLLALAYLLTELLTDERAMGAFVTPLLVLLQSIPTIDAPVFGERPAVFDSPLFAVHVTSLLFAYASFALGCVIGVTYMLLFTEIKAKHLGYFYARLPSLSVLDRMNMTAVTVGWVCLTMGIAAGGVWALGTDVRASSDPRLQAMTLVDPKIFVALVCWVLYSVHLVARRAAGWSARRSAWLSAVGFALVLLNFVPIGYLFTKSHSF